MKYKLLLVLFGFVGFLGCDAEDYSASDIDIKLAGRARLTNSLNDPGSLEIIDETLVKPGKNGARIGYRATFRAKNGFGGYITDTYYTE